MRKILLMFVCCLTAFGISAATQIGFDPIRYRNTGKESPQAKVAEVALNKAGADVRSFYANLYYKSSWDYGTPQYGLYAFPVSVGNYTYFTQVAASPYMCGNAGAVFAEGKYFVAVAEEVSAPNGGYVVMSMHFYLYDANNNWRIREIPDADEEFKAMDMAYNPIDGKVYGCFVKRGTDGYYYFGTLDIETGQVTMIQNYGQNSMMAFTGVACSDEGIIYGINAGGSLYTIDSKSGNTTLVAETGLQDQYMTSAVFDNESGKIYYALNSDMLNGIYSINPRNGATQRIYSLTDEESLSGMFFPEPVPAASAPVTPEDLTTLFNSGSLSGNILFTMPTKSAGGSAIQGLLEYTVKVNGIEMIQSAAEAGSKVTAPLAVTSDGEYLITVTVSNEHGDSYPARVRVYIGHDTPTAPGNVQFAAEDGMFKVTWDASQPAHGGYLNPAELTYTLLRTPDGVEVTLPGSQTSYSAEIPELATRTKFKYSVRANYHDYQSQPVESQSVALGSYAAPFTENFDEASVMADFGNIDGDGNGNAWIWSEGQLHSSICLERNVSDYLITPPVKLQKGMSYNISIDTKATRSPTRIYPERIAIFAGTDEKQLNQPVLEPTVVDWDNYKTLAATFTPDADGEYMLCIKACSDADMYWLWIDNLSVSAPFVSAVPAAVSDLTVTPDAAGALSAELLFTLPEYTISGDRLQGIKSVRIYRDGENIETLQGTPGEKLTWKDNTVTNGSHEYGVSAVSSIGESPVANVKVYVGVYEPVKVSGAEVVHGADSGELIISWEAPVQDTKGHTLPEGSVKYQITRYDRDVTIVSDSAADTDYTERVSAADANQEFVQYKIIAVGAGGKSEPVYTNIVTVGKFTPTPASESFAGGVAQLDFVVERDDDNASWTVTNDGSNPGVASLDADEGLLRFTGVNRGDRANFHSATFDISGLETPALSFYYLYPRGVETGLSVAVEWEESGKHREKSIPVNSDTRIEGWQRCILPLEEGINAMRFCITGVNDTDMGVNIFVDKISISTLPTPNAGIVRMDSPSLTVANQPFTISTLVENSGLGSIEAEVNLYKDNVIVDSKSITLNQGDKEYLKFEQSLPMILPMAAEYRTEVVTKGDKMADDNISETIAVQSRYGTLPAPRNLKAQTVSNNAVVTWDSPDLGADKGVEITDGAEAYRAFSIGNHLSELHDDYMGQWTSVDLDNCFTLGVGHGYETIPNATVQKGFMVFSLAESGMTSEAFKPASGDKMFVAFSAIADSGSGNDDWLISPQLSGDKQTISFKARSCTDLYGLEHLEVLTSDSEDPQDVTRFKSVVEDKAVPAEWKSYSIRIPAGTKYFAIRCKSANLFALLVDDITFTPMPLYMTGLKVTGYNLWRDGILLSTQKADGLRYIDNLPADGSKPEYRVTAIYGDNESRPSEAVQLDATGNVDSITSADTDDVQYTTLEGIRINGEPSSPGVYVRLSGTKSEKIIIK
ncbi:MAG: choice-of-anchor J domain-containing protein [Muribaculaceae bacterium]|nr:choice-of-anchor J domain-containing protein [Muribaculaceae bacterium]